LSNAGVLDFDDGHGVGILPEIAAVGMEEGFGEVWQLEGLAVFEGQHIEVEVLYCAVVGTAEVVDLDGSHVNSPGVAVTWG
jgi:hypothetical protein